MKTYSQLRDETSALHYDFLVLDTKTANTFLDIAQTTRNAETRSRNLQNAATAYATVVRLTARVAMTEQQDTDLHSELELLRVRMESFDHSDLPARADATE